MSLDFNHKDIKKIRKVLGLTQREMGAILGMSNVNVHYVETGAQRMSDYFIDRLQSELDIDNDRAYELIKQHDKIEGIESYRDRALYKIKQQ